MSVKEQYYQAIILRGGGMITCGSHLGVMVGNDILGCPKGWCFIPIEFATVELVSRCVLQASLGRSKWPKNQKRVPKTEAELLDMLFDSQDYIGG